MTAKVLGVVAGLLWLISLLLAWRPVETHYGALPRPINALRCRNPVRDAFGENGFCAGPARRRMGTLVVVLVLTGAASTAFVAACAADGRRRPAAE
jgi:hypothetical protein